MKRSPGSFSCYAWLGPESGRDQFEDNLSKSDAVGLLAGVGD
jgi:hypothetical protein